MQFSFHYISLLFVLIYIFNFSIMGCSKNLALTPPGGATPISKLRATDANAPYRIHPGDQLEIKFFYNKDLNEKTIVRPDGMITMQLIGEIAAEGLTPIDLKNSLTKHYAKHINDPEISVLVQGYSSLSVYVGGEVASPRLVNINGRTTALQAVIEAGNMTENAEGRNVVLLRRTQSGEPLFSVININEILINPNSEMNVVLKPNDVIFVPKTTIAEINQLVDQYFTQLIPISKNLGFSWLYNLNPEVQVGN